MRIWNILLICFVSLLVLHSVSAQGLQAGFALLLGERASFLASDVIERTDVAAFTLGFWVKRTHDGYATEIAQYFQEGSDTPILALSWYGSVGAILSIPGLDQVLIGTGSAGGAESDLTMLNFEWNFIALSVNFTTGKTVLYHNGTIIGHENAAVLGPNLPEFGRFFFGRSLTPEYAARPRAIIDQAFVILRELSYEEIMQMSSSLPSDPSIVDNTLFYWSFDNVSDVSPFYIASEFGAPISCRMLGSPYDIARGLAHPTVPAIIVSTAPFDGSDTIPIKQFTENQNVDIVIGSSSDTIVLLSLPSSGDLFRRDSSGIATGLAIVEADLPLTITVGVVYNGSFTLHRDSFLVTVNSVEKKVVLVQNSAPAPRDTEAWVPQGGSGVVSVIGELYAPPKSPREFDPYIVDVDNDELVCALDSMAFEDGSLSMSDGTPIVATPVILPDCMIQFTPEAESWGIALQKINITVADGLAMGQSTLTFSVANGYIPTHAIPKAVNTIENEMRYINFEEAKNNIYRYQVAKGGPVTTEPTFISITSFPQLGELHQIGSGQEPIGRSMSKVLPLLPEIEQWASEIIGFSSEYVGENNAYVAAQALGEPNVFPRYGDIAEAWGPIFPNEEEWLALRYPVAVYPSRVDVYQTLYSNTLWRISALPEGANATDGWVIIWETNSLKTGDTNIAIINSPPLCPITFKTRSILLEFHPAGPSSYLGVDAVSLIGYAEPRYLDMVDMQQNGVYYIPNQYANGKDRFNYRINRCVNYAQFRTANSKLSHVNVTIDAINQAPVISAEPILVDASNHTQSSTLSGSRDFYLPILDVEDSVLIAVVTSLPESGRLSYADNGASVQLNDRVASSRLLRYTSASCRTTSTPDKYNSTFSIQVLDGPHSVSGHVTLFIDCVGSVRRLSIGVEIAIYCICVFCVLICMVYGVLIFIWRDKKIIHSISPLFCLMIIVGAILANISPIFLTIGLESCITWLIFLTIGVCIFFGALASKTYRIDRIFHETSLKVFSVPNWMLAASVAALLVVQIILLIIWGVLEPIKTIMKPIPEQPGALAQICFSSGTSIIQGVQYSFFSILFLFTAVFAWRVRSIPLTEYKESREIFLATYNVGFVSIIAIPLTSVFWYEPNANLIVTTVATCFASTVSVLVLFTSKLFKISRGLDSVSQQSGQSGGGSIMMSTPSRQTRRSRGADSSGALEFALKRPACLSGPVLDLSKGGVFGELSNKIQLPRTCEESSTGCSGPAE